MCSLPGKDSVELLLPTAAEGELDKLLLLLLLLRVEQLDDQLVTAEEPSLLLLYPRHLVLCKTDQNSAPPRAW